MAAAHEETGPVLAEATAVMSQRRQVEVKQQLLDAFNAHFTVSQDELQTLTSLDEPVDENYFAVLQKVKRVHKDCQVLLGSEDQTLGLEIMEQSSRTLNAAFQKLYQWIQRQFKTLNLENPQISASIRRALRVLAERPILFQNCLDYFANAREHILSDAFHAALTGSSPDSEEPSSTKPIELVAHDPLRYVGDMLAWVHSATVSEREALEVLFISEGDEIAKGIQAGLESEPWSRSEDDETGVFDGEKALSDLVNRDLEGVGRMLRQRVVQVVQSHEESALAYRIANLVNFYRITFTKLLNDESGLLRTLAGLEEAALRQFRVTMKDHVAAMQSDMPQAQPGLSAPAFLDEALKQLKVLMKSYDASLVSDSDRESTFQPILTEALDPFLEGCEALARDFEEPANSIFVINCLLNAKTALAQFSFTSERVTEIDDTIDECTTKLVEYQHAFFLQTSGLHALIGALTPLSDAEDDLRSIPSLAPFQPDALTDISQTLDEFLPSALMDANENLKRLADSRMAQEITEEAAGEFCQDFEFVERRILSVDDLVGHDSETASEEASEERLSLRAMLPRTGGEIRVLLS